VSLLPGLVVDLHNPDDYPINAKNATVIHVTAEQGSIGAPQRVGDGGRGSRGVTPWIESRAWDKEVLCLGTNFFFFSTDESGAREESLGNARELGSSSSLTPTL